MDTKKITATDLQTKQHFEILDGLRGIAASAVVLFHFMEWVYTDFSSNFIAHGFLANFFFCLLVVFIRLNEQFYRYATI